MKEGGLSHFPLEETSNFHKAWWINRWFKFKNNRYRQEWMFEFDTIQDFSKYKFSSCMLDAYTEIKKTAPNLEIGCDKFIRKAKEMTEYDLPNNSAALNLISSDSETIFPKIAKLKLPVRIKNFLWELYRSKLPIRINSACPLCRSKVGVTGNHMLRCKWIQMTTISIFKEFLEMHTLQQEFRWTNDLADFYKLVRLSQDRNNGNELIALVLWCSWKTYNNTVRESVPDPTPIFKSLFNRESSYFNYKSMMARNDNQTSYYKKCINKCPTICSFEQTWKDNETFKLYIKFFNKSK